MQNCAICGLEIKPERPNPLGLSIICNDDCEDHYWAMKEKAEESGCFS